MIDKTAIHDQIVRQFQDDKVRVVITEVEVVMVWWKRLTATIGWRSGPLRLSIADKDQQPTDTVENYFVNEVLPPNLSESQIAGILVSKMKEYDARFPDLPDAT